MQPGLDKGPPRLHFARDTIGRASLRAQCDQRCLGTGLVLIFQGRLQRLQLFGIHRSIGLVIVKSDSYENTFGGSP